MERIGSERNKKFRLLNLQCLQLSRVQTPTPGLGSRLGLGALTLHFSYNFSSFPVKCWKKTLPSCLLGSRMIIIHTVHLYLFFRSVPLHIYLHSSRNFLHIFQTFSYVPFRWWWHRVNTNFRIVNNGSRVHQLYTQNDTTI